MDTPVFFLTSSHRYQDRFEELSVTNKLTASERRLGLHSHYEFDINDLPYRTIKKTVVPGSTLLVALDWLLKSNFDGVLFLEDDVIVPSDLEAALNRIRQYDFVSSTFGDATSDWHWFDPDLDLPQLHGLCCVSYLSRRFAELCDRKLRDGLRGHHERIFPSLAKRFNVNRASLMELGLCHPAGFGWTQNVEPDDETLFWHPVKLKG